MTSIKEIQIGDHEIKIVNFADDTSLFLRDITCFNRIQVILKLYEDVSNSKKIFGSSILDKSIWEKINEGIIKKFSYLEQSETLFEW